MSTNIEDYRQMIDMLDEQIVDLIEHRMQIVHLIGELKQKNGLPVVDKKREQELLSHLTLYARQKGLNPKFVQDVFAKILEYAKLEQEKKHDK